MPTEDQLEQWLHAVSTIRSTSNFPQREGQALFNALAEIHPELAAKVQGSLIDPFHRDDVIESFLNFVDDNFLD